MIYVIDAASHSILKTYEGGYGCIAPVLSTDDTKLFVCNRLDDNVWVLDASTVGQIDAIPVPLEPYAAALRPLGEYVGGYQ
ncbi:MAG: hypothetical protein GF344_15365 [Chitinivibrionales bacterium]|nr:hypothetical protein [Chitinivibrionales bacterium]MBD3358085.1 hypothetical protein [Chitinivibrionales bacterium]